MKLIYLLPFFTLALVSCTKELTAKDLKIAQINHSYRAVDQFTSKYNVKDSNTKVYEYGDDGISINDELLSVGYHCSNELKISANDVKEIKRLGRASEYYVKADATVDYKKFNQCIEAKLSITPLTFKQLQGFSNDANIRKFKNKYTHINKLIELAKYDGKISVLEAINIYLAVYEQDEKDLFKEL